MKVITGYKGFIGRNLLNRMNNETIYGIEIENCFESLKKVDWKNVECVYHLGAISDTTETDMGRLLKYNLQFTYDLFHICIENGIPVKYASSASVYGNKWPQYNPLNQYAMSKAMIDRYVMDNVTKFKSIQGYRFYNVYGKGEHNKGSQASPVHKFSEQAFQTGVIKVFEKSDLYVRDFIWVEDAIDCMFEDLDSGIYDVGTSRPISFLEVAELVAKKYKAQIEVIPFPPDLRNKYQFGTCAFPWRGKKFLTVDEYLSL